MKFETMLCGKNYKYETPADLIEQIRPDMEKAKATTGETETKIKEAYRKGMEEVEKKKKIFYVLRKAIEQLGGNPDSETTAKPKPAPENKTAQS